MFFNFGFGNQPRRRPRPHQRNQRGGQGFLGGLNNFLNQNFMNPLFNPPPQQQRQEEGPRPTFTRQRSRKERNESFNKTQEKKQEVVYSENTGMYWKVKANQAYKNGNLETALTYYNKAIELNNTESIFFSNRARCLKKMGKLEEALKDAQEAVQLDVDNIKGHLISGQILAEIGKNTRDERKVQNAVTRLKKALTLCVGQKKTDQFQHQISTYIYRAKKLLWYIQFQTLKCKRIQAINDYQNYLSSDPKLTEEEKGHKLNQFVEATNENIIFQIPDYLCCKITLQLMEEPVVTDSGIVYERSAIMAHIEKNGKTDPCSRKPISGNLYPCIPIKKAIEDFLEKNAWAYEYLEGEQYHDIVF